jgi:hypothetical protein
MYATFCQIYRVLGGLPTDWQLNFLWGEPTIGGDLSTLGKQRPDGIRYLSPEIQLLYKAKMQSTSMDDIDFMATIP